MKKRYFLLFFILFFGIIFWAILKDPVTKIQPVEPDPSQTSLVPDQPKAQKDDLIRVDLPLPNSHVRSPLNIKGQARGNWFFEASFPVILTDWDGKIIAQGIVTAQGDWMTTEYVPFTASLTYSLPEGTPYRTGYLILKKDNPSGESKFDNALEIKLNL